MAARQASAADQTVYQAWARGLELALSGTGWVSGGTPTEKAPTPSMTVSLAAGSYRISGTTYSLSAQDVTISAAHATLTRQDLVSVDSTGTATVTAGTPAAAPGSGVNYADPPDLPTGHIPIALVEVAAGVTSILDARIVDIRSIIPLSKDLIDAKGDLLVGTASDTISRLAVGANDTILMADSGEATGLRWQTPATTAEIADVAEAESAGTSDTWARGDHVHSGAAYVQEAIVDAKGDLISATAADTPARLAVGADDTILMADSAQATGLKWASPATTTEIADIAEAEAAGTSDTWARGDHVHSGGAYIPEAIVDAKGDLIVATAADTLTRVAVGSNDQVLTADSAQTSGVKWAAVSSTTHSIVRKTADESVTSSTTLQNDDALLFAIGASEVWVAEFVIFYVGNTTGDIKFAITVPASATLIWAAVNGVNTSDNTTDSTADAIRGDVVTASGTEFNYGNSINTAMLVIKAYIANSTNAGNVQLQWAQSASDGTATTVKAGSHLIAHKIA